MPRPRIPKPENFREQFETLLKSVLSFRRVAQHFKVNDYVLRQWLNEEYPFMDANSIRRMLGVKHFGGHGRGKKGKTFPTQYTPTVIPKDQLRPIEDFERPRLAVPVRYMTEEELKNL